MSNVSAEVHQLAATSPEQVAEPNDKQAVPAGQQHSPRGTLKAVRPMILVGGILALATLLWFATRPPPLTVQGEVSADRVDVSPRVGGRVAKLGANVGDTIERGAVLAELESPQLVAALAAARAALGVAKADLDRINSTRPETIAARKAELAAAEADVVLYQEAYNRQAQLARTGNTPQARLDEATRNLESAIRKREAAEAALQLAIKGASPEERALAAAQVKQAEAALAQREVDVAELKIHSPITGQITTRVAEIGENFSAGAVQLVFAAIGLPFFFLAGFAWPSEAIPEPIRLVAMLVPSTSAIDGLVKVGQLGASLPDVRGEFLTLWGLAAFYGCIAVLLEMRKRRAPYPARRLPA